MSSAAERVTRAMTPSGISASAIVGNVMCRRYSTSPPSDDEPPAGRPPHPRQPVQLHREDDDEDDARPVVRDGHADDGHRAGELVEHSALPERGEEAERDTGTEREDRRRHGENGAVRERIA